MAPGMWRPFFLTDTVVVAASSTGVATFTTPTNEEFEADSLLIVATSNAFNIETMQDESGQGYTNADSVNPLTGTMFPIAQTNLRQPLALPAPLQIRPNGTFNVTLRDTSGSENTIRIMFIGKRRTV